MRQPTAAEIHAYREASGAGMIEAKRVFQGRYAREALETDDPAELRAVVRLLLDRLFPEDR